jgi:hypothetical protein
MLPPRQPLPPPDDAPPPVKTTPASSAQAGPPRLPAVVVPPIPKMPLVSEAPESSPSVSDAPESGNVWMSFLQRSSLVTRLQDQAPWRRYALVAGTGLTLALVGLIAKRSFSRDPAASVAAAPLTPEVALPVPLPDPAAEKPPEPEPAAEPSAIPVPSAEPPPADEFSEDLKQRKLGYLTIHSSDPRANVYVNLKRRGMIDEKLTVRCGDRFVSIGVPLPPTGVPMWLAPGKNMVVPCGGQLEMTMDPQMPPTR